MAPTWHSHLVKRFTWFAAWVLMGCNGTGAVDASLDVVDTSQLDAARATDSGNGFDAPPPTCTVDASQGAASDAGVHVVQLTVGSRHSCALLDDGTVRCWGSNSAGQIGDGTMRDRPSPTAVALMQQVTQVSAGGNHTCAVTADQSVYCWGANESGEIGDGSHLTRLVPTRATLTSGANVVAEEVEAGAQHTCARDASGSLFCWGANLEGQLADGTVSTRLQSVGALTSVMHATGLSAGTVNTCAVLADGTARCWGNDDEGQLGNCQFSNPQTSAIPVLAPLDTGTTQPLTGVAEISVALVHACARMTDGTAMCWGNGVDGQLGYVVPTTGTCHEPMAFGNQFPAAKQVPALENVRQISTGGTSSCAVVADGTLWCWGGNLSGQIGLCSTTNVRAPVQVPIVGSVAEVRVGESHGCARLFSGEALCWGDNEDGRLGDGTLVSRRTAAFVQF